MDGFPQMGLTTHLGTSMPVGAPSTPSPESGKKQIGAERQLRGERSEV